MIQSREKWAQIASACKPLFLLLLLLATSVPSKCQPEQDDKEQHTRLGPFWLHPIRASNSESARDEPSGQHMSVKLNELLTKRLGPAIRASSDYKDFADIQLDESLEAWRRLHDSAKSFALDQVQLYEPKLKLLLQQSNVSSSCSSAVERFLESIKRLEAWAIEIWSASANFPPTGLLDGHFTDLGSYRGCVDARRSSASANNDSTSAAGSEFAASYCMLGFRPVVPSRPRFHQIYLEESENLTTLFKPPDVFERATHFAQYFHYLYMKSAVCVPVECSAEDMQQVAVLVGKQLALMPAPVRCITRATSISISVRESSFEDLEAGESKPLMIDLNRKLNSAQWVSLALIGGFFALVFLATCWHSLEIVSDTLFCSKYSLAAAASSSSSSSQVCDEEKCGQDDGEQRDAMKPTKSAGLLDESSFKQNCFYYFSMLVNGSEFLDTSMRAGEIKCLHGFRVLTMFWIICVHTLQYNDWSGFSRAFENEASLRNPLVQPLINANYVVDNFFLMSGLLAAYSIWHNTKGAPINFSAFKCLLGRYLRLTPQVLLISLAYILLPLLSSGPFWHDMTHLPARYCEQNWWLNLLHVQSFYREHQMCNLVGWWISVDMFYYVLGLTFLWLILKKRLTLALTSSALFLAYCTLMAAWRHYAAAFTPNNLGTVPQVAEVWSEFVVSFFWSPFPHAFPFLLGLWLGYLLANKLAYHFIRRHAKLGWLLSTGALLLVNYSTRLWMTNTVDLRTSPQYISTAFNIVCVFVWASAFGWMIVACHYGCAPALNRLLSTEVSVMLSKASFIIYLSHMLILRAFFGSQYNLLEVSFTTIISILIAMCFFSVLFGVFLCIAFEGPCLKFQRFVLSSMKRERRQLPIAGSAYLFEENQLKPTISNENKNGNNNNNNNPDAQFNKRQLNLTGPTGVTLLK